MKQARKWKELMNTMLFEPTLACLDRPTHQWTGQAKRKAIERVGHENRNINSNTPGSDCLSIREKVSLSLSLELEEWDRESSSLVIGQK